MPKRKRRFGKPWRISRTVTWERYDTQSMLGAALVGQKKFSEAEPLLIAGYEGIASRASSIPAPNRGVLEQAGRRIVEFYTLWGKPEQAAGWQEKIQQR